VRKVKLSTKLIPMKTATLGAALIVGALAAPAAAQPALPSYATGDEAVHGRVSGFDGKYSLDVRDDRGFVDHVQLHDGTVINPTGLRLSSGMRVTVYGHTSGSVFTANEIDTPYHAYPVAYGYPYYPYYPGPFYGVGLGFRFR